MTIDWLKQELFENIFADTETKILNSIQDLVDKISLDYPTATHFAYKGKLFKTPLFNAKTHTVPLPKEYHNDIHLIYDNLLNLIEDRSKCLFEWVLLRKLVPIEQNHIIVHFLPETLKYQLKGNYNTRELTVDESQLDEEILLKVSLFISLIEDRLIKNLLL